METAPPLTSLKVVVVVVVWVYVGCGVVVLTNEPEICLTVWFNTPVFHAEWYRH